LIEYGAPLSLSHQAKLLEISRSSLYYVYVPYTNPKTVAIRNAIDEIFTKYPFFGSRRIRDELKVVKNITICRDQVRGHMAAMGLEAVYPKQNTSLPHPNHPTYPYLLHRVQISKPDQVWGTDITYIRLTSGFCYLVALLDWYSRYIISWRLSPTLEIDFCLENLNTALENVRPDIYNSDQGSHFTSPRYTNLLQAKDVRISMDGRGRCMDNIFTERLWRTIKYENVYLRNYTTFREANTGIGEYIHWYNHERRHSSLENQTPYNIYKYKVIINQPVYIS
jgi:putative transposase